MVKITPSAPNPDHAKKNFSQALFFGNEILVKRKYLSYHLCDFCPFFWRAENKRKLIIPVENDVLSAEINQ